MVELLNKNFLSNELIEKLCILADEAARRYVNSRVPKNEVPDITVSVGFQEAKELRFEVEVALKLSELHTEDEAKKLAEEAVRSAFEVIDKYMANVKCQLTT